MRVPVALGGVRSGEFQGTLALLGCFAGDL